MKKQFHDIESLHAERLRLLGLCKQKEAQLAKSLEYVQDNFGSLVLRSLLPFNAEQKATVSDLFDKVNRFIGKILPGEDSKISKSLGPVLKLVQMIGAGLIYRYVKRFFTR